MRVAHLLVFVLACGGGEDGGGMKDATVVDGPPRDAAPDAPPDAMSSVVRVDPCPADNELMATVTTTDMPLGFVPADVTIPVNGVVKFAPGGSHNVIPHPTKPTDPGLRSGALGEVACLQFKAIGEFNYRCQPHSIMQGVVKVSN